jgi:predicted dehydrogenase
MRLKAYAKAEDASWWKPFEVSRETLQRADPLVAQMAHFADVIQGKAEPLVSARDGLQNLMVVEAITQAVKSRHEVVIKAQIA